MAILLSQPFDAATPSPLDARCRQPSKAAALAALDATRRSEGMLVWLDDLQQFHHFVNGTADDDFIPFVSGSGGGSTDTSLTETQINNVLTNTGFPSITG